MSRHKSRIPSIIPLKVLMELYLRKTNIPKFPEKLTESEFVQELTNRLSTDNVVPKNGNRLVNRLRGMPMQNSLEDCEGIPLKHINEFAKLVIEEYSLGNRLNLGASAYYWDSFEKFFEIPKRFEKIKGKGYYKFLDRDEQRDVDAFVARITDEIMYGEKFIHNYCVYFWNHESRRARVGLLQLDAIHEHATYMFLEFENDEKIKTIQRTHGTKGVYQVCNNTLVIQTEDDDPIGISLRYSFYIAIREKKYYDSKYLKGIITFPSQNGHVPTSCIAIFEKHESRETAINVIKSPNAIPPEIYLELIDKRLEVPEDSSTLKRFRSHETYKTLSEIYGAYLFGFYKNGSNKKILTLGICYIHQNGMMLSRIIDSHEDTTGYVMSDMFHGRDVICLTNFFDNIPNRFKYQYTLEIQRDVQIDGKRTICLEGFYAGIVQEKPRTAKIVFLKQNEFQSFKEMRTSVNYERKDLTKPDLLNQNERFIKTRLEKMDSM